MALTADNFQVKGKIRIFQTDPATGISTELVNKDNMILYSGADLTAYALAGYPNAKISHMYVGFANNATTPDVSSKVIDLGNSNSMTGYTTPYGYLRLPLSFPASYLNDTHYAHNIPVFSVNIAAPVSSGGAAISDVSPYSWFFEVALVAAINPSATAPYSTDLIFSRASFTPIQYNSSYALTISWGVEFIAN